jgi:hypothetical protein
VGVAADNRTKGAPAAVRKAKIALYNCLAPPTIAAFDVGRRYGVRTGSSVALYEDRYTRSSLQARSAMALVALRFLRGRRSLPLCLCAQVPTTKAACPLDSLVPVRVP